MKASEIGLVLARARRRAGLTQAQVSERMGTSQSVISRAEAGQVMPSLGFVQRYVDATGQPITIELRPGARQARRKEMRRRVRKSTGGFVFNPWDRDPSKAEEKSLESDGLTRERFERTKANQEG